MGQPQTGVGNGSYAAVVINQDSVRKEVQLLSSSREARNRDVGLDVKRALELEAYSFPLDRGIGAGVVFPVIDRALRQHVPLASASREGFEGVV